MTKTLEARHREVKRKVEMEIAIGHLMSYVKNSASKRILEFGSGDGYQIPYLKKLGSLIASDIYKSEQINKNYPNIEFVICDIRNTPFMANSFDMIFSNHVLEHIENITKAFFELKRIGKSGCIYAFTVPTSTWLMLSLPAQCYNGVRRLFKMVPQKRAASDRGTSNTEIRGWRKFFPRGHGWQKDFFDCLDSFRIKNWRNLFCKNGFKVIEMTPLLLYAPSEFPIVPTNRFLAKRGIYSSAIFIMRK